MRAEITNTILVTRATFLSVHSIVFLLPYSPALLIHPNPNHSHHFGDIRRTDPMNKAPAMIIAIIIIVRSIVRIQSKI